MPQVPTLDVPTLLTVIAIVIAFSGFVLMITSGHERNAVAIRCWGGAMVLGGCGIAMFAIAALFHGWGGIAGDVFVQLGIGLSWTASRVFAGQPPRPSIVLTAIFTAFAANWLALPPNSPANAILPLLVGAGFTLATARELGRGRGELLPSRDAAVFLLLLHAAIYATRAAVLLVAPHTPWLLSPMATTVLLFEALLHTLAMAFFLMAMVRERAELAALRQLRQLVLLDGLTGLGNRRRFDEALDLEFRRNLRDQRPLALLMIDADWFKAYNDTYGHQMGDDCLRAIAGAIAPTVHRPGDVAARYGGEEFAVLLSGTDTAGAVDVAQTIYVAVAALLLAHAGSDVGIVSVSIGVAAFVPSHGSDPAELVGAADAALYNAKNAGRNRIVIATGSAPAPLERSSPTLQAASSPG